MVDMTWQTTSQGPFNHNIRRVGIPGFDYVLLLFFIECFHDKKQNTSTYTKSNIDKMAKNEPMVINDIF